MPTTPSIQITKQGTQTPAGVVNFNPNTGEKLASGQAVAVKSGGNTYGSMTTPVVTSKAATKDLNNIKTNVTDINNGIANQNLKVTTDKAATDAKNAADKAASDAKAAKDKELQIKADALKETGITSPDETDPAAATLAADRKALADAQQNYQDQADQVQSTILGIQNGSIPLNSGEQAQVAGLQNQFQTLIGDQILANKSAQGLGNIRGYQTGSAEYDPSFQVKTIGTIVTAGLNKVADLNMKMASAVATLTQSLKDNDISSVKDAWGVYQDASQKRTDAIQKTINDSQAAIKDAQDAKQKQQDSINSIATDAAKNGADPATIKNITNSGSITDAIIAAGDSLQTASGQLGDYLQYKRDAQAKGLVPQDYASWKAKDDQAQVNLKAKEAYATKAAQNSADANSTASDKTQQKLEQQYRQVLSKEFSARTGALGVENAKVNQANHLNSLFTQYYDPKTGNYNIPTSQYAELAIGLANLISPAGSSSDADRAEIKAKTAAGDIKGAIQYITGVPQNGNTQDIIKNLIDSVDRQAETATRNREAALQNMRDQAPTDLESSRIDKLNKSTEMVGYEGDDRIAKSAVNDYVKAHPDKAATIAKLYEIPGATDQDIRDYLQANGELK